MAPKVKVPTDFGKHHIGSPAHSNLILKLKDGDEVKANSMILSFNSPIIDHLTTNLHQSYLDMDDFQGSAVNRFVESMYSGELEGIEHSNFRDINKMCHVFNVSWLVDRCSAYFQALVDSLTGKEYDEMLYIVEEARFLFNTVKKHTFLDLVSQKMSTMKDERNSFVERYILTDFKNSSKDQLNFMIEMMGTDVHVLVKILTKHIVIHKECLDDNSRYLLEKVDLSLCQRYDNTVCSALVDALGSIENTSMDDYQMTLKIISQFMGTKLSSQELPVSTKLPNLFLSFDKFIDLSFDKLIDELAVCPDVSNIYIFFDAVWMSLFQQNGQRATFDDKLKTRIMLIQKDRGWGTIAPDYLSQFCCSEVNGTEAFATMIQACKKLLSEPNTYYVLPSREVCKYDNSFFLNEKVFTFQFPESHCSNTGSCGLVLKVTPSTVNTRYDPDLCDPELFDIKLCTDPNEYPTDLHFHAELMNTNNIHLGIQRIADGESFTVIQPLSWCGKPSMDQSEKFWKWGIHYCDNVPNRNDQATHWANASFRWKRIFEHISLNEKKLIMIYTKNGPDY